VNRAAYILFGITPIGFILSLVYAVTLGGYVRSHLGTPVSTLITFTVPYIIGAFIGDWIGRRRNYRFPMSL